MEEGLSENDALLFRTGGHKFPNLFERRHSCLKPACGMNNVTKCGAKKGETPLLKYSLAHRESPHVVVKQPLFGAGDADSTNKIQYNSIQGWQNPGVFVQKPVNRFSMVFWSNPNYPYYL
jgi:hypothetical protein